MKLQILRKLIPIACLLVSMNVLAYDFESGGIYYNITSTEAKTVEVTYKDRNYNSYTGDVVIPETVTKEDVTYSATSIGNSALKGCSSLTSVTIPNSVTSIGNSAFYGCTGLTRVTIPNSVTSIGSYAFEVCTGLTSVKIGNNVSKINYRTFKNCSSLVSILIGSSVEDIDISAFWYCSNLSSINVDKENKVYDSRDNCNAIIKTSTNTLVLGCKNTEIPNTVTIIGYSAFEDCINLTSINIPNSIIKIESSAFVNCSGLTTINIPNSVREIGSSVFMRCINLKSVTLSNNITKIESIFSDCKSLKSIEIPEKVISIYGGAFRGCSSITSIRIPKSVEYINNEALNNCENLNSIIVDKGNTTYDSRDNCNAIIETISNTLISGCKTTTIPNTVTSIGSYAFQECCSLTSVTIPNSVTSIGGRSFFGCSGLTSIVIPNSIKSIGANSFEDCANLNYIKIPDSLTSIESGAFYNTAWYNNQKDGILYLDNHCIGYKGDRPKGNLAIKEGIKVLSDYSFKYCNDITSVSLPNSVTNIGLGAFFYCAELTSINLPNTITRIEQSTFYKCSSLSSVVIPNTVISIGSNAFGNCDNLKSLIIPNSVEAIEQYAFYNCINLNEIKLSNNIKRIGYEAFKGTGWYKSQNNEILYLDGYCLGYKGQKPKGDIVIKDGTKLLCDHCISDCGNLKSVKIPNSVIYIGKDALSLCETLSFIELGKSVKVINEWAFAGCPNLSEIISLSSIPPYCDRWVFGEVEGDIVNGGVNKKTCLLKVPHNSVDIYKKIKVWKDFKNISGIESSNIKETLVDETEVPVEYYNLNGTKIENPGKGIYIKRQGTRTSKVVLQ